MRTQEQIIAEQKHTIDVLTKAEATSTRNYEDAFRVKELLEKDKQFLKSELTMIQTRYVEATRLSELDRSKLLENEGKIKELTDQLLSYQLNARTMLDEKMTKEMNKIRSVLFVILSDQVYYLTRFLIWRIETTLRKKSNR
jgi:hypothetical protein